MTGRLRSRRHGRWKAPDNVKFVSHIRDGGLDLVQWKLPDDQRPRPREATMQEDTPSALGALQVDETKLKGHVDEVVRSTWRRR
jgi:hypothetical protein